MTHTQLRVFIPGLDKDIAAARRAVKSGMYKYFTTLTNIKKKYNYKITHDRI